MRYSETLYSCDIEHVAHLTYLYIIVNRPTTDYEQWNNKANRVCASSI